LVDTQKIFAVVHPVDGVQASDLDSLMQFEAAHLWSLYERGTVREVWSRTDAPGAVYVLESTVDEARALLADQPMVRAGMVGYELAPVAAFTCFSDLFGTQLEPVRPAQPFAYAPVRRTQRVLGIDRLGDGSSRDELEAYAALDARHAWALTKAGVVREAHRRTDRPGAVFVFEAVDVAEARFLVDDLPLARQGLVQFDLYGVGAFLGLEALLDGGL
jgi:hypothetical protein